MNELPIEPEPGAYSSSNASQLEIRQQSQHLSVSDITGRLDFIKDVMAKAMKEGEDYGTIPGTGNKPCLLQPGAQKLALAFHLKPQVQKEELRDLGNYHREYAFVVRVGGNTDGVGTCSTLEAKYRWRGGSRKCPQCGKETIIKGKKEYGGGWICFAKRGGCGAKWLDGAPEIESQNVGKVEHDNPADFWNTVRKMAFKRAFVHAIINATNTSQLWTQDLEEGISQGEDGAPSAPEEKSGSPAAPQSAGSEHRPSSTRGQPPGAPASPPPEIAASFLKRCKAKLVANAQADAKLHPVWWKYGVDQGWYLSTEPMATMVDDVNVNPFGVVPTDGQAANITRATDVFKRHEAAVSAMAANLDLEQQSVIQDLFEAAHKDGPPATPAQAPAPAPAPVQLPKANPNPFACPQCRSTATKRHKDYELVHFCEKCGWQWDSEGKQFEEHEWQKAIYPRVKKGEPKPTLGQLERTDSKRAFGIVMNFKAETNEYKGKVYQPTEMDILFAAACQKAKAHIESKKNKGDPDEEDVPF